MFVAGLAAALALTGCAGGGKSSTTAPANSTSAPAQGSDPNKIEKADPKAWYAQTCPAKAMKYAKSSGLYLGQGAVTFSKKGLEDEPRLWRYDKVTETGTPISMVDASLTFCYRWDSKTVTFKYQGEKVSVKPIFSPDHPTAAGYYVTAPSADYTGNLWSIPLDNAGYSALQLKEDLTPLTDAAKASPEPGGNYAPGEGPG